jgi:hypothetical protein
LPKTPELPEGETSRLAKSDKFMQQSINQKGVWSKWFTNDGSIIYVFMKPISNFQFIKYHDIKNCRDGLLFLQSY